MQTEHLPSARDRAEPDSCSSIMQLNYIIGRMPAALSSRFRAADEFRDRAPSQRRSGMGLGGHMTKINVNGHDHAVEAAEDTPLLWIIREHLEMTGTKFGCGGGFCGACTVHLDGVAVHPARPAVGSRRQEDHHHRGPAAPTAIIRCRRPGSPSRCRNAAIASPGRSCRRRRCCRRIPADTRARSSRR